MNKIKISITIIISFFLINDLYAALSKEKLEKKEEGWYITGLPLVNYSSDTGLGYGVRAYLYDNGQRTDKYFDEAPYFSQLYAQFFQTTAGFSYHEINLDTYNIFGTKYRIKTYFVYDRMTDANFFGIGEKASKKGLTDINGNEYSKYEDYEKWLKSNDHQYYKFNKYKYIKPTLRFNFFGDITDNFKFLTGFDIKWTKIETWEGKRFDGQDDKRHTSDTTLLDLSKDSLIGFDGGWTNYIRLGAAFDSRDYDPDPGSGYYIDYSFIISNKALGSDYDYFRSTFGARAFYTIFNPLVLALRVAYTDTSGGTPFYETQIFDFLFGPQEGLGGFRTLRGYHQYRFMGQTMTLGNVELRFKFAEITPFGQRFEFKLVALGDAGNVYDRAFDPFTDPTFGDYKYSYGGGLVIAWNQATIIHAYFGFSPEASAISVNFDHTI